MPHEPKLKVKVPKYLVVTTDGEHCELHGATNDPIHASAIKAEAPSSIVLEGQHHSKKFDKPVKLPKE